MACAASRAVPPARSSPLRSSWPPPCASSRSRVTGSEAEMPAIVASLTCGFLFGLGLLMSGLTQPQKVLAFLDVLGPWDPTLAFVMAAALGVTAAGYAAVRRRQRPLFAAAYLWP